MARRQWTDEDLDRFRDIYETWYAYEKGRRDAMTADELAASLTPYGMSKATMYKFRDNGWRYPGEGTDGETVIETLERIAHSEDAIATLTRQVAELQERLDAIEHPRRSSTRKR